MKMIGEQLLFDVGLLTQHVRNVDAVGSVCELSLKTAFLSITNVYACEYHNHVFATQHAP